MNDWGRVVKGKKSIEQYDHVDQSRKNNPPVGLVTPDNDHDGESKTYAYDPHLDPTLQWAGKAEHTSFEVPTVSLHVHERIDPRTIIEAVEKEDPTTEQQPALFETPEENPPLRQAIDFYEHEHSWSNRLVAGDSLLVMNSLLEKEGLAGQVQMIYIDPPYGIKYGSNFQPFVNKRNVKDGKDDDLTAEPEMIRAFRDTWELGIHSYLTHLRDRLLLARELLTDSGSVFVQISDENLHLVRNLMDEVFGPTNFLSLISFQKTGGFVQAGVVRTVDYVVWYVKDAPQAKIRQLYMQRQAGDTALERYNLVEMADGTLRNISKGERATGLLPEGARRCRTVALESENPTFPFEFEGRTYTQRWKTNEKGLNQLSSANRLIPAGNKLDYLRYVEDFPVVPLTDRWESMQIGTKLVYVVQTAPRVIQNCLLMTTDPGDLVLDPTCGSGTTAFVAEQWGRRWISCDTSRVAVTLAKQRLMTALFDYHELAHPEEGVSSGFKYKTVPHVTLKSIANNPDIREGMSRQEIDAAIARHAPQETLYDQPIKDNSKTRVTGPFTVEAVPAPSVKSLDEIEENGNPNGASDGHVDSSVARSGPTLRHEELRDELLKSGIRGKGGQRIRFTRVEPLGGTRYLHADAETDGEEPERVVVSFGPEYAPLEQRQVEEAIQEATTLVPKPKIVAFAAFQFDPEAAKDISEVNWPGVTLLKAQMNTDLLTGDLKKKQTGNESFWLIGQPDVELLPPEHGDGKYTVEVRGFDYYNTKTGGIESGDEKKIAVWMLDPDYDGRSLYPRQVFFPLAGAKDGWSRLAKNLKAQIDEDLIEAYRGTVSLPFEPGERRKVAVKIVDDRGIESLKVMEVE